MRNWWKTVKESLGLVIMLPAFCLVFTIWGIVEGSWFVCVGGVVGFIFAVCVLYGKYMPKWMKWN